MLVENEDTTGTGTTRQGFCRNIRAECSGRWERTGIGRKGIVVYGRGKGIGRFDVVGGAHGSLSVWVGMPEGNLSTLPRIRQHLPDTHNLLEPAHNDDQNVTQNTNPKLAQLLSWGNKHAVLPPATSIR